MAKYLKMRGKVKKVMGEYSRGELHSGSKAGPTVTDRRQAIAIALSEARRGSAKDKKRKVSKGPKFLKTRA